MKIAILGTENSHANTFSQLILEDPQFSDIEVVGIYGYDDEANRKILETGVTAYSAKDPHEFLGKVDAVICTARHGDHHYEYLLPYIEAGIPAFVDKPFTVDLKKGYALLEAAEKSGALLCGGSSLRFLKDAAPLRELVKKGGVTGGFVSAPVTMVNPYGDFYFYAAHLIETMFAIFGRDVKAVNALCPDETKNRISLSFDYGDFDVLGQYHDSYQYTGCVFTKEETRSFAVFELLDIFRSELAEFVEMVRTGKEPQPKEELIRSLVVMHAIEDSWKAEGKRVEIQW